MEEIPLTLRELEAVGEEIVNEERMIDVLTKAKKIHDEKKKKKTIKNKLEQDFSKGGVRNQKCPLCGTKLKKCKCGFLL
jgi:DNA repair exonuclease SbcCD ATPase subunit